MYNECRPGTKDVLCTMGLSKANKNIDCSLYVPIKALLTVKKLILLPLFVSMASCGGGGSSSDEGGNSDSPSNGLSRPSVTISSSLSEITRENSPKLASVIVDLMRTGRDIHGVWLSGSYFDNFTTGEESGNCEQGGSYRVSLSADRKRLSEHYDNCHMFDEASQQYITLDGDVQADFSGIEGNGNFTVEYIYSDYTTVIPSGEQETVSGVIEYRGNNIESAEFLPQISLTIQAINNWEGTLRAENFNFSITDTYNFLNGLSSAVDVSGKIEYEGFGTAQVLFSEEDSQILLSGNGPDMANVTLKYSAVDILFDAAGDGRSEYGLQIPLDRVDSIPFEGTAPSTPYVRSERIEDLVSTDFVSPQTSANFSVLPNFMDGGGHLIDFSLQVNEVRLQEDSYDSLAEPAEELPFEYTITQPRAGQFLIDTEGDLGADVVVFELSISGVNTIGNASESPLPATVYLYRDTDGDGIRDTSDDDDDNDGVPDSQDMLPKDPNETVDSDQDGIGDNSDPDDDNDGTDDVADFYPKDALCYAETDGDGERCWFHTIGTSAYSKIIDREGVVYYYMEDSVEIKRWDSRTEHFMESINLEPASVGSTGQLSELHYAEPQHALYIKYDDRVYSRIDLSAATLLEAFYLSGPSVEEEDYLYGMDFSENFVVILGQSGTNFRQYSYDLNGALMADHYLELDLYDSPQYRRVESAPFCTIGFKLDVETGGFVDLAAGSDFDGPCGYMQIQRGMNPIVSPDGSRAIISDGSLIDVTQEVVGKESISWRGSYIGWTKAGIFYYSSMEETLYLYNGDGELVDSQILEAKDYMTGMLINDEHLVWFDDILPVVIDLPLP